MKKKYLAYALVSAFALAGIGASTASAHGWFGGGLTPDQIAERQTAMFQKEADLVGISVEQYKTEWADGKSLREIATAHNVSETDLHTRMADAQKAEAKKMLSDLVAKGVITQVQADKRLTALGNRQGKMGFAGFGRGHGRMMMAPQATVSQ